MLSQSDKDGLEKIIRLFNLPNKKSVEKYCRDLVIRSEDLANLLLAGRVAGIHPYRYANHFSEFMPKNLHLTRGDLAEFATNGVGPMSKAAQKASTKMSQAFVDRRLFAAHLFFTPSHNHWHLFYFDQRDTTARRNHWKIGGPHIHYSREAFSNKPLSEVWKGVCETPPELPSSIHVRYDYHHNRRHAQSSR